MKRLSREIDPNSVTVDVLVQHRSSVPVGRDLVQIEVARIALVRRHQKRPIVAGPPVEVGLQLRPRRQVTCAPVRILDEDVRQLIPTLIARVEKPLIGREVGQGEDRVRGRRGQRYRRSSSGWDGVGIPDPRCVRRHENPVPPRRPRGAAELRVSIEIVNRVHRRCSAGCGGVACEADGPVDRHAAMKTSARTQVEQSVARVMVTSSRAPS